jgi:hypothetical protein
MSAYSNMQKKDQNMWKTCFQLCYSGYRQPYRELCNYCNVSLILTLVVLICKWSSQFWIKNNPVFLWVIQSVVQTSWGTPKKIYMLKCRMWVKQEEVASLSLWRWWWWWWRRWWWQWWLTVGYSMCTIRRIFCMLQIPHFPFDGISKSSRWPRDYRISNTCQQKSNN